MFMDSMIAPINVHSSYKLKNCLQFTKHVVNAVLHFITNDIDEAKVISVLRHKSKFNFYLFWKEI